MGTRVHNQDPVWILQFEICGCIYLTVSAEILIFYNSVNLIP